MRPERRLERQGDLGEPFRVEQLTLDIGRETPLDHDRPALPRLFNRRMSDQVRHIPARPLVTGWRLPLNLG